MKNIERRINFVYFVAAAAFAMSLYAAFIGRSVPTASAQTDLYLSRRVDQVDQRIYSLESRLNRLESASTRPSIMPQTSNTGDVEIQFLRTQLDGLRARIGELECGVLRLDERTLTPARKQSTKTTEPCRQDSAAVVKLSARP